MAATTVPWKQTCPSTKAFQESAECVPAAFWFIAND